MLFTASMTDKNMYMYCDLVIKRSTNSLCTKQNQQAGKKTIRFGSPECTWRRLLLFYWSLFFCFAQFMVIFMHYWIYSFFWGAIRIVRVSNGGFLGRIYISKLKSLTFMKLHFGCLKRRYRYFQFSFSVQSNLITGNTNRQPWTVSLVSISVRHLGNHGQCLLCLSVWDT